ncbi:MAG: hypothetical protein Q8K60_03295 [Parachlamydiaceae bacterium]|nr:hypothetical protein [Parachlamydiaceae bacterium]
MEPTTPNSLNLKELDKKEIQKSNKKSKLYEEETQEKKIESIAIQNLNSLSTEVIFDNNSIQIHHFLYLTDDTSYSKHNENLILLKSYKTLQEFKKNKIKIDNIFNKYKNYPPRLLIEAINFIVGNYYISNLCSFTKKYNFQLLRELNQKIDLHQLDRKQNFSIDEIKLLNQFLKSLILLEIDWDDCPKEAIAMSQCILTYLVNNDELICDSRYKRVYSNKAKEIKVSNSNLLAMLKFEFNIEETKQYIFDLIPSIPFKFDYTRPSHQFSEQSIFVGIIIEITPNSPLEELERILYLNKININLSIDFYFTSLSKKDFDFTNQIKFIFDNIKKITYLPFEEFENEITDETGILLDHFIFNCKNLNTLELSTQAIRRLPSIQFLDKIEKINLVNCTQLKEFSNYHVCLPKLNELNLKGCVSLESLPLFEDMKQPILCNFQGCSLLKNITKLHFSHWGYFNFLGCLNFSLNDNKFLFQHYDFQDVQYQFEGFIKKVNETYVRIIDSYEFKNFEFKNLIDDENSLYDITDILITQWIDTPKKLIFLEMLFIADGLLEIKELLKSFYLLKIRDASKELSLSDFNKKIVNHKFFQLFIKRKIKQKIDYFKKDQIIFALDLIINLKEGNENNPNYEKFSESIYQLIENFWNNIKIKSESTIDSESSPLMIDEANQIIDSLKDFFSNSDGNEIVNLLKNQLKKYAPNFHNDIFI